MTVLDTQQLTPDSQWSCTATLHDDGGLVLTDLTHDVHPMATDIRVVAIWVFRDQVLSASQSPTKTKCYVLGSKELPATSPKIVATQLTPSGTAPYPAIYSIRVDYKTADPVFGGAGDSGFLEISQVYRFTSYSNTPSHEPAGVISAARLYPIVRIKYTPDKSHKYRPDTIRVDYRCAFDVDSPANQPKATENSAALMFDASRTSLFLTGAVKIIVPTTNLLVKLDPAFSRSEKPLRAEILGQAYSFKGAPSTWDNIHQWAGPLPYTPGASHAIHQHWRWGSIATSSLLAKGGSLFSGTFGDGTAMIDPKLPNQALHVAITGGPANKPRPDLGATATPVPSTLDWSLLFEDQPARALATNPTALPPAGSVDAQWFSFEVDVTDEMSADQPVNGRLFLHGLFFAHDIISTGVGAWFVGRQGPIFIEDDLTSTDWDRK